MGRKKTTKRDWWNTSVNLEKKHQVFLYDEKNQDFNLSEFVRIKLDKEMKRRRV